jgi:hypothetical protein
MRIPLVEDGKANATLVIGNLGAAFDRWVAGEIQRYVRLLTGVDLPVGVEQPAGQTTVLVGSPKTNSLIGKLEAAGHIQISNLKSDGFVLKSLDLKNGPTFVVAGADERATMYAAYDLIERLGVSFQLSSDILPTPTKYLALPPLDVRLESAIKHRGLHMRHFVMPKNAKSLGPFGSIVPLGVQAAPRTDGSVFIVNTNSKPVSLHLKTRAHDRLSGRNVGRRTMLRAFQTLWLMQSPQL